MAYKGKRVAKSEREMPGFWLVKLFLLGYVLGNIIGFFLLLAADAKEPEPEPRTTAAQQVDEPAATEYAVWTKPVPEIVTLENVTVTHYCPCEKCCGEWADGITATGTKATEGRTLAVDPDVIPYGTEVCLRFEDGTEAVYIAEDCGGAIKGNRVDVYMDSHDSALAAGIQTATAVFEKE